MIQKLKQNTIVIVNYNSSDFVKLNLLSLEMNSSYEYEIIILDNGSRVNDLQKLKKDALLRKNVTLLAREQSKYGSMGHGEALNELVAMVKTKYCTIIDADCVPLMKGWDQFLISRMSENVKIAGTPPITVPGAKPIDFPLIYLCAFETEVFKSLEIDLRPDLTNKFNDTGYQMREKYHSNSLSGFNLNLKLGHKYDLSPLKKIVCALYYTDDTCSQLLCSHFARGSNPKAKTHAKLFRGAILPQFFHYLEKRKWIGVCKSIIHKL